MFLSRFRRRPAPPRASHAVAVDSMRRSVQVVSRGWWMRTPAGAACGGTYTSTLAAPDNTTQLMEQTFRIVVDRSVHYILWLKLIKWHNKMQILIVSLKVLTLIF